MLEDLHLQHQKPKLGYNRKTNNTVPRKTWQNNTHIDLLLSPSLGKEINQAQRFSELKSRTKLLRRLPQLGFMPRIVRLPGPHCQNTSDLDLNIQIILDTSSQQPVGW